MSGVTKDREFAMEEGDDLVELDGSTFDDSLLVRTGLGDDDVAVGSSTPIVANADATFGGGLGIADEIGVFVYGNTFALWPAVIGFETVS